MKTLVLEEMPPLFWETIEKNGWENYFEKEISENSSEVKIVIIRTKTIFDKNLFNQFPRLKMIIRAGSGFDNIDLREAKNRHIEVCNTPKANVDATVEHTLAFIFSLIKNLPADKTSVLNGTWKDNLTPNLEISDLKILIVGVGRIGTKVGKKMQYLGAEVRGVDPYLSKNEWKKKKIKSTTYKNGICWCNLLTFHCPLTAETKDYFSLSTLNILRQPIYLLNVARGGIVSEKAIEVGISSKKFLGVALDVYQYEPWRPMEFAFRDNILLSPHLGAFTKKAKERIALETIKVWRNYSFHRRIISSVFDVSYKII